MSEGPLYERRVDRKGFVAVSALAALAAAGGGRLTRDALAAAETAEQGGVLHYYNWADYVNPKTYTDFTRATGISVKRSFYVSNEALLAKLKAGARGFDLAVPTGYMVQILAAEKLLEPIDWSKLPTVRRTLDPMFKGLPFDPRDRWSVPKDWGTTGYVFRTDRIKERPATWKAFFALFKKYPRKFTLLDGSPEVIGSVLVMLGHSYNSDSAKELEEARKFLLDLKPYVHSIDSVTYKQKISAGKAFGGMAWNGDGTFVITKTKGKAEYVVASEGGEFWVDSYVIPVGAKNPDAAHEWIDFVYQPKVNVQETSYTYYGSPLRRAQFRTVAGSKPLLRNDDIFPPAGILEKLEANSVSPRGTRLRERIWTEFKSA
jgi:spermidine/putrescine transport system substrate-binding protein